MIGLLDGIRVLDLTNVLAGPFASYQLGLLGADVLKVETPDGGDLARRLGADAALSDEGLGISFLAQNAGKRSIALDLKTGGGKAVFRDLVTSSDVLVENFRPGVLERLGFGWAELRELNPRLVYCAISGFGQSGPLRNRPAYDQIIQGMSGLMSVTGTAETAPLRVGAPVCDSMGGMAAAFAIAAALVRRGTTGLGAFLDVSMLEATVTAMGWVASDQLIGGVDAIAMGNDNRTAAPSGTFETGDGALNIAANKQEQFVALCGAVGRPDLAEDVRFASREARKTNRAALTAELEERLRTRSASHWDAVLLAAGVPAAPVLDVRSALGSQQILDRGLVSTVESPIGSHGPLSVLGSPVHVDGAPQGPRGRPPLLGEHSRTTLVDLGYTSEQIDRLQQEGAVTWPTPQPTGGRQP